MRSQFHVSVHAVRFMAITTSMRFSFRRFFLLNTSTTQTVAKNTFWLLASDLVSRTLGFLLTIFVARSLGTETFGVFTFVMAFVSIFSVIADFGLSTYAVREIARDPSRAQLFVSSILRIKVLLSVITLALILTSVTVLGKPEDIRLLVLIAGLQTVIVSFSFFAHAVFRAFHTMQYEALGKVLSSALTLGIVATLLVRGATLGGLLWGYVFAAVLALFIDMILLRRKSLQISLNRTGVAWRDVIRESWPLGAMLLFIMIYFRIDVVMLSVLQDDEAVGIYGAGYRLSELTTIIPAVFLSSVFPFMARYFTSAPAALQKVFRLATKYLLTLALPIAVTITLLARFIVTTVFGPSYAASGEALTYLVWAAAIMYVTMVIGQMLISINRQRLNMVFTIVAVGLNIVLNILFIPRWSYVGASIATICTELFGLVIGIAYLRKYGYTLDVRDHFILPFGILAMSLAVLFIVRSVGPHTLALILFNLTYGLLAYRWLLSDEDRRLARSLFHPSS